MKVLLIGMGGMGKVHYANSREIDGFDITAVVGRGADDRKAAEERGLPFYESIDDAIASIPLITVVDITTPTFLHKYYAIEALEHGLDVISEKPLALSAKDAEQIFSLAEKKQRHVYVAQVLRYTKEYSPIKRIVEEGRYGRPVDAFFSRMSSYPGWAADSWLFDKSKSGLVPFDLHIHDLDIIISSFGIPLNVSSEEHTGCGDYWNFTYDYDGFSVRAEAGWIKAPIPFSATYRIIFEHGTLSYDGEKLLMYEQSGAVEEYDISYDKIISTGINVPPTGWYYEELKAIKNLLESGLPSNVEYEEVVSVLRIVEGM